MNIDINTKMITLLGTPLSQSFAARMQNKAYESAGMNIWEKWLTASGI